MTVNIQINVLRLLFPGLPLIAAAIRREVWDFQGKKGKQPIVFHENYHPSARITCADTTIFATMSNPPPDKQPSPAKPHWVVYVLAILVVLFLLQKMGCGPIYTKEKMEWIDR